VSSIVVCGISDLNIEGETYHHKERKQSNDPRCCHLTPHHTLCISKVPHRCHGWMEGMWRVQAVAAVDVVASAGALGLHFQASPLSPAFLAQFISLSSFESFSFPRLPHSFLSKHRV